MNHEHLRTARLVLDAVTPDDVDELFALSGDPRVWTHFPAGVHTSRAQTAEQVERFVAAWAADGLGYWVARSPADGTLLGVGGCAVRAATAWNLYYRFAAEQQGRGYASELGAAAVAAARATRPELPVAAWLLEHNTASLRTALRVGLRVVAQGPDDGGTRLVLADRDLDAAALHALGPGLTPVGPPG